MYYSSFGALAIILHLIINYDIIFKNAYEGVLRANREYRGYLCGVMLYYVADVLWGTLYDLGVIPLIYADTVLYFYSMVLSVFLWTRYIIAYLNDNSAFDLFLKWAGILIFAYEIVFLVINFFAPVVFYFGEDGTYFPQTSRYVTLTSQVVLYFITSVHCFAVYRKKSAIMRLHYRTIGISGVVATVFIILQTMEPMVPYYAIGCIISTCLIHQFVLEEDKNERQRKLMEALEREKRQREEVENARKVAYTDALCGVKNKHAFVEMESDLDESILNGEIEELGIAAFDLNNLKTINDTLGHEAGDRYIKNGCALICKTFQHSPVFRVGGDEFIAILRGEDYTNRLELLREFDEIVKKNLRTNDVVVASGLAEYDPENDINVRQIYERADKQMYRRKAELKNM